MMKTLVTRTINIMAKIHTRTKRRSGLSTTRRHYHYFHGSGKKHRPKTFKTEEAANAWALKQGLKPEQYNLKNVKHNKKFQILFIQAAKLRKNSEAMNMA